MRLRKTHRQKGVAFLETVVVAGMMAGIMIALVYGVNSVVTTSIDQEADRLGSYAQARALITAIDKDFANADRVFIFEEEQTNLYSSGIYNFDSHLDLAMDAFRVESNATSTSGSLTPVRSLYEPDGSFYGALLAQTPLVDRTARTGDAYWELHFVKGNRLISVLTVSRTFDPDVLTYNRYTSSSTSPIQSFSTTNSDLITSFMVTDPILEEMGYRMVRVRVPNPRADVSHYTNEIEIYRHAK